MSLNFRSIIAVLLCQVLILAPMGCHHRTTPPPVPVSQEVFNPLQEYIQKPYLELFEIAPTLEFNETQIQKMRDYLKEARDYCVGQYKKRSDQYATQLQQNQKQLQQVSARIGETQRHDMHCEIQNLQALKSQTDVLANQGIPVAYDNREAKLKLIEQWPGELKQIKQEIASGAYQGRKWGDVKDIGFREIAPGQEKDIDDGQEAIRQMKMSGLMPPEVENKAVVEYVSTLATRIARRSDLRVPVKVTVLNSKEINAFALPGGFLFVQRGLLDAAEDESQLAGVLAHEIAHAAARHSHKLMTKATISQIIYQAAEVAAMVLTGGVAGIGLYYALQYGFYGLGLILSLNLLGVSRDYELEADQLGVQYTWNSDYDPTGFIRFFDKMATKEGYVNGMSWFRTHPPFYERMVRTEREIMYLPKKSNLAMQTSEFQEMKKELTTVKVRADEEEKNRPSLRTPEANCPPPQKAEYQDGQPVEAICKVPQEQEMPANQAQRSR